MIYWRLIYILLYKEINYRLYCQPPNPYRKRESTVSETTTTTVVGPNSTTTFLDKSKKAISENLNEWDGNYVKEIPMMETNVVVASSRIASINVLEKILVTSAPQTLFPKIFAILKY